MHTQIQLFHNPQSTSTMGTLKQALERAHVWPLSLPDNHELHLLDVANPTEQADSPRIPDWIAALADECIKTRQPVYADEPCTAGAYPVLQAGIGEPRSVIVLIGPHVRILLPPLASLLSHISAQEHELNESARFIQDAFDQIVFLLQASNLVTSELSLREILRQMLQTGIGLLQAEGGMILFADPGESAIIVNGGQACEHYAGLFQPVSTWRTPRLYNRNDRTGRQASEETGPEIVQEMARLQMRSLAGVSVGVEDKAELVFILFNKRNDIGFLSADREMIGFLAQQLETVLRREKLAARQRLEREMEVAQEFCRALLPSDLPTVEACQLAVYSEPAWDIGGDFYWLSKLDAGDLLILLGDAAGKGLSSAFIMGQALMTLRAVGRIENWAPARMLTHAQEILVSTLHDVDLLVTAVIGRFNPHTGLYQYADAGHGYSFVRKHATGEVVRLPATGIPLGPIHYREPEDRETYLQPGDQLLIISDGVVDAISPYREVFGLERFVGYWGMMPFRSGRQALSKLMDSVWDFIDSEHVNHHPSQDDMTALLLQYHPDQAGGQLGGQTRCRFPGTLGQISMFTNWIRGVASAIDGWSYLEQYNFVLASVECFTNIVRHAYRKGELAGEVDISVQVVDGFVRIAYEDQGMPFAHSRSLSIFDKRPPRASTYGGYGLYLMEHLSDELRYQRVGEANRWQMAFGCSNIDNNSTDPLFLNYSNSDIRLNGS